MSGFRYAARLLKGIAHPTRLAILQILREDGESCVCHLEHALGKRQAYISQQLARLRKVDLVHDRREGLNVYYALSSPAIGGLLDAVVEVARNPAQMDGYEINFDIIRADHCSTCPCPKCAGETEEAELLLKETR